MLRPSFGSCSSISKRLAGRMPPIAPSVPQNMAVPAGSSGPPGRRDSRSRACEGSRACLAGTGCVVRRSRRRRGSRSRPNGLRHRRAARARRRPACHRAVSTALCPMVSALRSVWSEPSPSQSPSASENSTGSISPEEIAAEHAQHGRLRQRLRRNTVDTGIELDAARRWRRAPRHGARKAASSRPAQPATTRWSMVTATLSRPVNVNRSN